MPHRADAALDELCEAARHAQAHLEAVLVRADAIRAARAEGRSYGELIETEQRPLIVELLSTVLDELAAAGSAFRRAEARALHDEGLSQEAIAALFGVTRQRVSALLREARAD